MQTWHRAATNLHTNLTNFDRVHDMIWWWWYTHHTHISNLLLLLWPKLIFTHLSIPQSMHSVLWCRWVGDWKSIRHANNLRDEIPAWLPGWNEVQITSIWSSWRYCQTIISASQNSERFSLPGLSRKKTVKQVLLLCCNHSTESRRWVNLGNAPWCTENVVMYTTVAVFTIQRMVNIKPTLKVLQQKRFFSASIKLPSTHLADMEDRIHAQLKVRFQQQCLCNFTTKCRGHFTDKLSTET